MNFQQPPEFLLTFEVFLLLDGAFYSCVLLGSGDSPPFDLRGGLERYTLRSVHHRPLLLTDFPCLDSLETQKTVLLSHLLPGGSENTALGGVQTDKPQCCYPPAPATLTAAYNRERLKPRGASGLTPPLRNLQRRMGQHWSDFLYPNHQSSPNAVPRRRCVHPILSLA